MATFQFTSPDGAKYSVNGPDGSTPEQAFQMLQQHLGSAPAEPPVNFDRNDPRFSDTAMAGKKFFEGIPVLGGLVPRAGAALSATFQPLTGVGAEGDAWSDRYAQDLEQEQSASHAADVEHPVLSTTEKLLGGLATTAPLASTVVGARLLGLTGNTLAEQIGAGALSGSLIGGTDAATRANSLSEAPEAFAKGALTGAAFGSGFPIAGRVVGAVGAPLLSAVRSRWNPQGVAESQYVRAALDSGLTPQEITRQVTLAAREGQNEFTAADAMGNAGQRLLSTVTNAPGPGRTEAVDFLNTRQAGQGRRMANILSEGLEAPQTAQQLTDTLTRQRDANAAVDYGIAHQFTGPVDITPAVNAIDRVLQPGVTRMMSPQTGIADNSVESVLRRARSFLTDANATQTSGSQLTDFNQALMAKREIDHLIDSGSKTQQAFLIPVRNTLDAQLAGVSPTYKAARDAYRQMSQRILAIPAGTNAAKRGRLEDTIQQFQNMTRPGPAPGQVVPDIERQAAFRTGYADPLIEQVQGAAMGVNKARPFTSDAYQQELRAIAPDTAIPRVPGGNAPGTLPMSVTPADATIREQMMRRLARENTMFDTRYHGIGGTRTAENLQDLAAQEIDPSVIGAFLSGNFMHAGLNAARGAINQMSGYTPAVRQHLAPLLLASGRRPNVAGTINRVAANMQARRELVRNILGLAGRIGATQVNQGMAQP